MSASSKHPTELKYSKTKFSFLETQTQVDNFGQDKNRIIFNFKLEKEIKCIAKLKFEIIIIKNIYKTGVPK